MASVIYNSFFGNIMNGGIDLDTDTIKIALVTGDYTPDVDAHEDFADVTNEVVGDGYSAGGETLSVTVTVDDANDKAIFDADDVTWSAATITAAGAVIYKSTGVAGTSLLICYIDFGGDIVSTAGDFVYTVNAGGILTLASA